MRRFRRRRQYSRNSRCRPKVAGRRTRAAFRKWSELIHPLIHHKTDFLYLSCEMESQQPLDVINHHDNDSLIFEASSEISQRIYEKKLKLSVRTVLVTMFLSSMGFTICIPSLWLYFSHFEECRCHVSQSIASAHEAIGMVLPAATHGLEPHRFGVRSSIFRAKTANISSAACILKNATDDPRALCKERSNCNKFSGQ